MTGLRARLNPPVLAVVVAAGCIAFSAIFTRLSGASPGAAAVLRCAFALPVLLVLVPLERRRRGVLPMPRRAVWIARLAGLFLSVDLVLWTRAIEAVGAGLATVLANLQVLVVGVLAWWLLGERPSRNLLSALPAMALGVVMIGGLLGGHSYGAHPGRGVVLGVVASAFYSGFILLLRQSGTGVDGARTGVVQPLFEATVGAAVGSLVLAFTVDSFRLPHPGTAIAWLLLLALTSQVVGWLLITAALPLLPAAITSALLLIQPAGSVALGAAIFGERPSPEQLAGVVLVLAGVAWGTRSARAARDPVPEPAC